MLQLVVRSKYNAHPNGLVKGSLTTPIRQRCIPQALRDQRSFFVQVSNICSTTPFQGCCLLRSHANVFSMSEVHFLASFSGEWDLFLDQTTCNGKFILVPQRTRHIVLDCRNWSKWTYLGTCQASILRMDMEDNIKAWHLRQNQGGQRDDQISNNANQPQPFKHHCHLIVYMDSFQASSHADVDYKHRAWAASHPKIAKRLLGSVFFDDEDDERRLTYSNNSKVDLSHALNYSNQPFWNLPFSVRNDTAAFANTIQHANDSAVLSRSKIAHNKENQQNNDPDRRRYDRKKR